MGRIAGVSQCQKGTFLDFNEGDKGVLSSQ